MDRQVASDPRRHPAPALSEPLALSSGRSPSPYLSLEFAIDSADYRLNSFHEFATLAAFRDGLAEEAELYRRRGRKVRREARH